MIKLNVYDKQIFQVLKESWYDTKEMKYLLLDIRDTNKKIIYRQQTNINTITGQSGYKLLLIIH